MVIYDNNLICISMAQTHGVGKITVYDVTSQWNKNGYIILCRVIEYLRNKCEREENWSR